MEQDKSCVNCVHFKDIYIIYKARFKKCNGFCSNKSVYMAHNKNKFMPKLCDKWQQKPSIIEEERENVTKTLKEIRKSLAEIALIFKEGEI